MTPSLLRVNDLDEDSINSLLLRARELSAGAPSARVADAAVGLAFLQPSLRTRIGYLAATHRVGARPVEVIERRSAANSFPESIEDTVRVLSGYVDALVVRSEVPAELLADAARAGVPYLNGGDGGPLAEHPSQALIDLFAMEQLVAPVGELHIAMVGDLRMRAARSLLRLLTMQVPGHLSLVSDEELGLGDAEVVEGSTRSRSLDEVHDVDVLYVVGLPKGPGESVRSRLRVDAARLDLLSPRGAVLSPLPIIDEVTLSIRHDRRLRYFEQSDLGMFVRIALIERLLGASGPEADPA